MNYTTLSRMCVLSISMLVATSEMSAGWNYPILSYFSGSKDKAAVTTDAQPANVQPVVEQPVVQQPVVEQPVVQTQLPPVTVAVQATPSRFGAIKNSTIKLAGDAKNGVVNTGAGLWQLTKAHPYQVGAATAAIIGTGIAVYYFRNEIKNGAVKGYTAAKDGVVNGYSVTKDWIYNHATKANAMKLGAGVAALAGIAGAGYAGHAYGIDTKALSIIKDAFTYAKDAVMQNKKLAAEIAGGAVTMPAVGYGIYKAKNVVQQPTAEQKCIMLLEQMITDATVDKRESVNAIVETTSHTGLRILLKPFYGKIDELRKAKNNENTDVAIQCEKAARELLNSIKEYFNILKLKSN